MQLSIEGKARIDILNAAHAAGKSGAHIAPSLSLVEILLAVLSSTDKSKDSIILSKGHGALGYYAAMHQCGQISTEQFETFEQNGGEFPGQPSRSTDNGIEFSSGTLGMGLSYGLGSALAKQKSGGRVFVVLGDGELNEGSVWEAAALASRYRLDNLIAIVDNNGLQSDGKCEDITGQVLFEIWKAYGWQVAICDGHSVNDMLEAISQQHSEKPLAVLAKTIKGKGVSFMENNNAWHHSVLKDKEYQQAVEEVMQKYGSC